MKRLIFIYFLFLSVYSVAQNTNFVPTIGQRVTSDPTTGALNTSAEILHTPVKWATTATLPTNTYNNGTSGVGATLTATANGALSVDGNTVATNDRILVKNETTGANNGIYIVTQAGDGTHPYILTRGSYSSIASNLTGGMHVTVQAGTVNAGFTFYQTTLPPITIGTTNLVFGYAPLSSTGVTAASYTNLNATIGADGRITAASNGSSAGIAIGTSITSATQGSVLFAGSGGILMQKNSDFFYDSTNRILKITNSIGVTSSDGFSLNNTTAAAAGAQQWSPAAHWQAQGWKTAATAASQRVDMKVELQSVQGSTNPTGNLVFSSSVNGAAYSALMNLSTAGILTVASTTIGNSIAANGNIQVAGGANKFAWGSSSMLTAPTDGTVLFQNSAATGFTALNLGGTTSSFPSLRVNGTVLQAKLADNSAWTTFEANPLVSRFDATHATLFTTSSTSLLGITGLTGLTIPSAAFASGNSSDSVWGIRTSSSGIDTLVKLPPSVTTASNGLTASSGNIVLGGTLSQTTNINGNQQLNIGLTTPLNYVTLKSGQAITLQATAGIILSGDVGSIIRSSPFVAITNTPVGDSNYTILSSQVLLNTNITANRVLTLPTSAAFFNGILLTIVNYNTSAFNWSFGSFAGVVKDAAGNTVTNLVNGATYTLLCDGTNYIIQSILYGVTGGPIKYQHTIFTPTTGGTVNLVNKRYNIINPVGSLLALTVNLPSSPANNDVVYIKYTQTVSTVTYANGTVVAPITAPIAGGLVVLTYDSGTTSWY